MTLIDLIAQLHIQTRLRDLERVVLIPEDKRKARLTMALGTLPAGAYLVGAGPYTAGVIPLSVGEVILGRYATPLEQPGDKVIDYDVADSLFLGPVEVSRCHCTVRCRKSDNDVSVTVQDKGSTAGTFVNKKRINASPHQEELKHGDILSLGGSGIACYVLVIIGN